VESLQCLELFERELTGKANQLRSGGHSSAVDPYHLPALNLVKPQLLRPVDEPNRFDGILRSVSLQHIDNCFHAPGKQSGKAETIAPPGILALTKAHRE
jgi:hypothetical protein